MSQQTPEDIVIEAVDRDPTHVAGGGPRITGPAGEALSAEGPAEEQRTSTENGSQDAAWVFSEQAGARRFDLAELPEIVRHDENLAWIDLCGFTESRLRDLAPVLGLRRTEIHAALSRWQRPQLGVHDGHFFVSVTVARLDSGARRVMAAQLDLSVGNNYLLSLHQTPLPFADRILTRARSSPELVQLDSGYMLYIVLDELLAYYEDLYEEVQDEVELMEERALTDASDIFLDDLLQVKRFVSALSRLAEQHRQVFAAFLRPDFSFVRGEDVEVYYRDLDVRLSRLIDTLETARDSVNGAFDIYVSHAAHRTNQIIKVLTIVSTLLLPMTLIVTVFTTSFHGIPLYGSQGFVAMIASMAVVTSGTLIAFRRRGWL